MLKNGESLDTIFLSLNVCDSFPIVELFLISHGDFFLALYIYTSFPGIL